MPLGAKNTAEGCIVAPFDAITFTFDMSALITCLFVRITVLPFPCESTMPEPLLPGMSIFTICFCSSGMAVLPLLVVSVAVAVAGVCLLSPSNVATTVSCSPQEISRAV